MTISCPECAHEVSFTESPGLSEIVQCADCQSELEVVTLDPLALALAPEIEEDWGE